MKIQNMIKKGLLVGAMLPMWAQATPVKYASCSDVQVK